MERMLRNYEAMYFKYLDDMLSVFQNFDPFASYKDASGNEMNPIRAMWTGPYGLEVRDSLMRELWKKYNGEAVEEPPRPPLPKVLTEKFGIPDQAIPELLQTIMSYTDIVVEVESSRQSFSSEQTLIFHLETESGLSEADGMEDGLHTIIKDEPYYVGHAE